MSNAPFKTIASRCLERLRRYTILSRPYFTSIKPTFSLRERAKSNNFWRTEAVRFLGSGRRARATPSTGGSLWQRGKLSRRSRVRQWKPSCVEGRAVTGFTLEGYLVFNILDRFRTDKVVPVVEAVTVAGGFYSTSMNAFDDYSVTLGPPSYRNEP